jgi:superfamily II DNA or RNA helicase
MQNQPPTQFFPGTGLQPGVQIQPFQQAGATSPGPRFELPQRFAPQAINAPPQGVGQIVIPMFQLQQPQAQPQPQLQQPVPIQLQQQAGPTQIMLQQAAPFQQFQQQQFQQPVQQLTEQMGGITLQQQQFQAPQQQQVGFQPVQFQQQPQQPQPQQPQVPVQYPEVQLIPSQIEHYNQMKRILSYSHIALDTSPTGAGKTFVTGKIAQSEKFSVLIICPTGLKPMWTEFCGKYGIPTFGILSFGELRSKTGSQPAHGFLRRVDTSTATGRKAVEFVITPLYENILTQKMLLVVDEVQNIKNNSAQYKAVVPLVHGILRGGQCRCVLLSATPFDKPELSINMLRLIGYIRSAQLYVTDRQTDEVVLKGLQELINACSFINQAATQEVLADMPPNSRNAKQVAYALYVNVVKAYISSAAPLPKDIPASRDFRNGYYIMNAYDDVALRQAVGNLATAAHFDERTGQVQRAAEPNFGAITKALQEAETAKINTFARLAENDLRTIPGSKVIIYVSYLNTIDQLYHLLAHWNPIILRGDVKPDERARRVAVFNENPNYRLLIANIKVGKEGISLHDTVGNAPRYMYLSPNYSVLDIHQAAGRIYRVGTKSNATIRIVYGKGAARETKILEALARKTQVLKDILEEQISAQVLFPGDYASYTEEIQGQPQ